MPSPCYLFVLYTNFQSLNVIFLFMFHIRMVKYLSVRSVVVLHMSSLWHHVVDHLVQQMRFHCILEPVDAAVEEDQYLLLDLKSLAVDSSHIGLKILVIGLVLNTLQLQPHHPHLHLVWILRQQQRQRQQLLQLQQHTVHTTMACIHHPTCNTHIAGKWQFFSIISFVAFFLVFFFFFWIS